MGFTWVRWVGATALVGLVGPSPQARAAAVEYLDQGAFEAAAGSVQKIGFDEMLPASRLLEGDEYRLYGLRISNLDGHGMYLSSAPATESARGPWTLSASFTHDGYDNSIGDNFRFEFVGGTSAAGVWVSNVGPGPTELTMVDADGNALATHTFDVASGFSNRYFFGVISDTPIAAIVTTEGTGDSDGVRYDDIQYIPGVAVPQVTVYDNEAVVRAAFDGEAVVDFDDLDEGDGTFAGTEYADVGLVVTHLGGSPMHIVPSPDAETHSPPHTMSAAFSVGSFDDSKTDHMRFDLLRPSPMAGIGIGNVGPGATEIRFLNVDGDVIFLRSWEASSNYANKHYLAIESDVPIHAIRSVEESGDADGIRYDDVLFIPVVDQDGDGVSPDDGDCDDDNDDVYPDAPEQVDEIDNDCDDIVDEGTVLYDDDGDGFSEVEGDCDDDELTTSPDADETADGVDQDCDGRVDEGTDAYDDDGDGFSDDGSIGGEADCDDGDASTWPGAAEAANDNDDDCDDIVDEGTVFYDDDGDGAAEIDGDCDDSDSGVYVGAAEIEDGVDNNCNGLIDESTDAFDDDGDGVSESGGDCDDGDASTYPGAPETEDQVDNDCDGAVDEDFAATPTAEPTPTQLPTATEQPTATATATDFPQTATPTELVTATAGVDTPTESLPPTDAPTATESLPPTELPDPVDDPTPTSGTPEPPTDAQGCSCASSSPAGALPGWVLLALGATLRRRRRPSP